MLVNLLAQSTSPHEWSCVTNAKALYNDVALPFKNWTLANEQCQLLSQYLKKNVVKNLIYASAGVLGQGISTYAHEWGHLQAVKALYIDADPIIRVRSWIFGGGFCMYELGGTPSPLGAQYSHEIREGFIAAGGPIVDYVNIALSLGASWKLRNRCKPLAIAIASHATMKSARTFKNYYLGSERQRTDYYEISTRLSIPDESICLLTATSTLISGIWLSYLISQNPSSIHLEEASCRKESQEQSA